MHNTGTTKLRPERATPVKWAVSRGRRWTGWVGCAKALRFPRGCFVHGSASAPDPTRLQSEGAGGSQEMRPERQTEAGSWRETPVNFDKDLDLISRTKWGIGIWKILKWGLSKQSDWSFRDFILVWFKGGGLELGHGGLRKSGLSSLDTPALFQYQNLSSVLPLDTILSGIKFFSTKYVQITSSFCHGKALGLVWIIYWEIKYQHYPAETSGMMEMLCIFSVQNGSH